MKNVRDLQIALSGMVIITFLLIPFSLNGQSGKANFSGTWTMNAEKSNFGPGQGQSQGQTQGENQRMGGFGGGNFVAKQEGNFLTVERYRTNQNGKTTKTETRYTLDGKECVKTTGRGESKSTAVWAADGKTLKIVTNSTFTTDGKSRTMKSTEEWSLTGDNTLSVKTVRTSKNGDRVSTIVYNRK